MTSSLLKKRRTIRQNTLGAIDARRAAAGLAALLLAFVLAGDLHAAPWQDLFGKAPAGRIQTQPWGQAGSLADKVADDLDVSVGLERLGASSRAGSALTRLREAVVSNAEMGAEPVRLAQADATPLASTASAQQGDPAVCAAEAEACRQALEQLRLDRISEIDLDIRVSGVAGNDYPCECRLEGEVFEPRRFATTTFTWKAAGYCHKPLYFEQWNFERYGHSYGWAADPFISAAHFFGTLPILPYKMGVELPWECVYPVGYYRPGNCAPWTVPAFPVSVRGMAVEAATVTGLVFLLP
jgi:hypothetical protein